MAASYRKIRYKIFSLPQQPSVFFDLSRLLYNPSRDTNRIALLVVLTFILGTGHDPWPRTDTENFLVPVTRVGSLFWGFFLFLSSLFSYVKSSSPTSFMPVGDSWWILTSLLGGSLRLGFHVYSFKEHVPRACPVPGTRPWKRSECCCLWGAFWRPGFSPYLHLLKTNLPHDFA